MNIISPLRTHSPHCLPRTASERPGPQTNYLELIGAVLGCTTEEVCARLKPAAARDRNRRANSSR